MMDGEKFKDLPPPPQIPNTSGIETPIRIVLETMVRGMVASCKGVPPELVLTVIAWHVGNSLGDSVEAPQEHKDRFRDMVRSAFLDGVEKSGQPPPAPPSPSPGASQ